MTVTEPEPGTTCTPNVQYQPTPKAPVRAAAAELYVRAIVVAIPIDGTDRSDAWTTRLPPTTSTPSRNEVHGVDGDASCVGGGLVSLTAFRPSATTMLVTSAETGASMSEAGGRTALASPPANTGWAASCCAQSDTTRRPRT